MFKHEINYGTLATVESRLAWAKKAVNRVYFWRIHFQMVVSHDLKNIFSFVFNDLKFTHQRRDVN